MKLVQVLFLLLFINSMAGCESNGKNEKQTSDVENIKKTILAINSQQQSLYKTLNDKKDRGEKYATFCHDSLVTVTGYGYILTSAYDASRDLVDGYADTIHDINLRVYDNTAILTGKAKMFILVNKDTLYEDVWISKVFMNFGGQWKMVLRNSGPLAVNYKKAIKVAPEKLLTYEGVYGPPGGPYDTFRVVNDQLYQIGANNLKVPYYPVNDSTFFTKDDLGTMVFQRTRPGEPGYFEWILPDGQSLKITKK